MSTLSPIYSFSIEEKKRRRKFMERSGTFDNRFITMLNPIIIREYESNYNYNLVQI